MCLSIAVKRPSDILGKGEYLGFEWQVIHTLGFRHGYVKVPQGHSWHGQDENDIDADVHGGLILAEADEDCGIPDDNGWWVGFNCAHEGDAPDPLLLSAPSFSSLRGEVRSQEYVEAQCRYLCEQAHKASGACNGK